MKGDMITKFSEKPQANEAYSHLINAGVYFFEPEVSNMVNPETVSLEGDIFPNLAKEQKLYGYFLDSKWLHLHDKEKYEAYVNSLTKQN